MRLLFQSLERFVGPLLAEAAHVVYWVGLVVLAVAALMPFWRFWVERATARAGVEQRWVGACPGCGQVGPVWAGTCASCGADLGVPWLVRWRTRGAAWLASPAFVRTARVYHLTGAVLFLAAGVWMLSGAGGLSPAGVLHRLFLGVAFLAFAAVGRGFGRACRLERRGPVARAGDAIQGFSALGVLAIALFFASGARPVIETPLASFVAGDGVVRMGNRVVRTTAEGEVGVEYLQVNHEGLGYAEIVPLAVLGAERVPLPLGRPRRWLVSHLRKRADAYERRGVTVRVRVDRRRVTPGDRYEVVESGGQVVIRKVSVPVGKPAAKKG